MSGRFLVVALACLVGCNEYEWHSNLDGDLPPSTPSGLTTVAEPGDPGDPSGGGGEDTPPWFGDGSGAIRPDEPPRDTVPPDDTPPPDEESPPDETTPPDEETPPDGDTPEDPEIPLDGDGRMTGGGSVWDGDERVTHGFQLRCDLSRKSNLEINWDGGRNFHLEALDSAACWDDPTLDPGSPSAGFDTFWGVGVGSLDGVDGVAFEILFTDDGERGDADSATIVLDNGLALDVTSLIDMGNHQAHGGATIAPPASGVPSAAELADAGLPLPSAATALGAGCSTVPSLAEGASLLTGLLIFGRRRR